MIPRLALAALLALAPLPCAWAQPAPAGAAPGMADAPPAASPTEALFNAINLGDLDQVRGAVAAGADIGRRNVLGLTPLDLAVDLGHAEIAFYLMSLGRVSARPAVPQPPATPPAARPPVPRGQATLPPAPAPSPTGAVAVAPLWQGGGGSPVPEAGFLGFDAGRPEGGGGGPPPPPRAPPPPAPPRRGWVGGGG
uniref:hypothetical protein n=1 Tax=Elioraea sp. TaxID=2185103 RepID=UPI003F7093AC